MPGPAHGIAETGKGHEYHTELSEFDLAGYAAVEQLSGQHMDDQQAAEEQHADPENQLLQVFDETVEGEQHPRDGVDWCVCLQGCWLGHGLFLVQQVWHLLLRDEGYCRRCVCFHSRYSIFFSYARLWN